MADARVGVTPASVAAIAEAPALPAVVAQSAGTGAWQGLVADRVSAVALGIVILLLLTAIFAPWLAPYDPVHQFDVAALKTQPPSSAHWFGTDPSSRDVFSRVIHGARVSLTIAVLAVTLSVVLGTMAGAIAGWVGGRVDTAIMRVVDALVSIPRVLLLLGVVAMWGQLSPLALVTLIGLTGWFGVSRLVRAEVLVLRERDFVHAALATGAGRARVLVRHVLPHAWGPVLVAATLGVGNVIVVEAGLSFLGFGVPQPRASWGSIIRDGREVLQSAWWLTVFPGLALLVTVLAVNVLADRLRMVLNPRHLPRS